MPGLNKSAAVVARLMLGALPSPSAMLVASEVDGMSECHLSKI